jgi:hypothetical protein
VLHLLTSFIAHVRSSTPEQSLRDQAERLVLEFDLTRFAPTEFTVGLDCDRRQKGYSDQQE